MRVKSFANKLGTTADTIRYYTRIGYLSPSINAGNGYKVYSNGDEARMRFILSARQLGFSVDDIGLMIREAQKGNSACPLVRELIITRLAETEALFLDTNALRKRMTKAIQEWEAKPNRTPTGEMVCHLIEEFASTQT